MSNLLNWIRRPSPTPGALFRKRLFIIVGGCGLLGASMELFMIKTGFYAVATRKEAERRAEAAEDEYQRHRAERKKAELLEQQQRQGKAN